MPIRVRPSEILQEDIINALGWSVEEAAEKIGIPFAELTAILGPVGPKLRFWPTQRTLWEHGLRD